MSHELADSSLAFPYLEAYTMAALLVLEARLERGNATTYDQFLCDYIGDPTGPHFRPISADTMHGHYDYNNPHIIQHGYTPSGTMLDIRHVQGQLHPDDALAEFFVATADLKMGTVTEWRVLDIDRPASAHGGRVALSLSDRAPEGRTLELVSDTSFIGPIHFEQIFREELESRRKQTDEATAHLVLDAVHGITFAHHFARPEPTRPIRELVEQVNDATEYLGIDLVGLARQAGSQAVEEATILSLPA